MKWRKALERHPMATQAFLQASAVLVVACLGYRIGLSGYFRNQEELFNRHHPSGGECARYENSFKGNRGPASEAVESEYLNVLAHHHLEEKGRKMAAYFRQDDLGLALTQLSTLLDFGPGQNSPEGKIVSEALKYVESEPMDALGQIREALSRMGWGMPAEKQFLNHLISKLDVEVQYKWEAYAEQVNQLALAKESTSLTAPEISQSLWVPLMMAMQIGEDAQVEGLLKKSLELDTSYHFRSALLSIYELKYPENARRLRNELEQS